MENREDLLYKTGEITAFTRSYLDKKLQYYKLEAAERMAKTSSSLITGFAVVATGAIAVLMLSMVLGFYLATLWDSLTLGFLAVSLLYIAFAVMIFIFRTRLITNPVVNYIIQKIND